LRCYDPEDVTDSSVPQGDKIHVHLDPTATLAAYARHRRRFAAEVKSLDEAALAVQSRCSKWTVADVLRHGCDVDGWMQAIWAGGAPPFTSFDPLVTPHEFVIAGRAIPDVDVRARYVVSAETMAAEVGGSGAERWGMPSISPVGFVPWWLSALHIFYDSWVHERDVLLPLGVVAPIETDEAVPVLAYSLALVGTLVREPIDTVIADVHLRTGEGPAIATPATAVADTDADAGAIIDALSGRGAVEDALPGTDPDVVHRLGVLARIFQSVT
jgi:uncharacterized protein (TIGR03083 family)